MIVIIQKNIKVLRLCIINLKYSVPKKVSVTFRNESNYNYHFTIEELKGFKKRLLFRTKHRKIHNLYSCNR